MKRDMDLVRDLLLKLEAYPAKPGYSYFFVMGDQEITVEGRTDEEVLYHLQLLRDHELIDCPGSQPMDGITFTGLSWEGHDFADSVRDSEIWRATKEGARQAGGFSVDLLVALAKGLIKKKIEEHTGVKL